MTPTRFRIAEPPDTTPEQRDGARLVADALADTITENIQAHPRSLQRRIGPSEIGMPCTRRLIHKLAGDQEPDRGPAWKPTVGTACHAQMEEWFGARPDEFQVEQRVTVGRIGSTDITGSTDLFIPAEGVVVDWKFVGPTRLRHYRSAGPGDQYRTQAHLYGKGWAAAGHQVNTVMIVFIPRDGELTDSYAWWEPFDPMVGILALIRANQLHDRIQAIGRDATLAEHDPCQDRWCPWCAPANRAQKTTADTMFAAA